MRERTDKSDPNYITTAQAVCESIRNPVTEEFLINSIQHIENHRKQHQFLTPLPPNSQSHQATTSSN